VAWGVEGLLLLVLARRLEEGRLRIAGHLLFAVLTVGLAGRLASTSPDAAPRLVRPAVLSELVVLGLALTASFRTRRRLLGWAYRGVVLVGWLAWWVSELAPLANGQAYASAVWGATAAALLVGGAWADTRSVQFSGLATLGLFVGKLFFVDLASLAALWRIALFLGSGIAFLAISYLLPGFVVGRPKGAGASGEELSEP